jgi:Fe-S oxidoreductase
MCNNNGHCRKFDAGTMCPSYRVTRNERDLTRGRANALRLALSGQLGNDALTSHEMYRTLELCVSCKGCKRECPTGVDMARMKIEFLHRYHQRHRRSLMDDLVAHLPRYAPRLARSAALVNLRDRIPGVPWLTQHVLGIAARRSLPVWRRDYFRGQAELASLVGAASAAISGVATKVAPTEEAEVVLLADTFNRYFEPDNLRAAVQVLATAGYRVTIAEGADGRALCCGRTYLATGMVENARAEASRMVTALRPFVERGVAVVGLEPSCLLGLRDEFKALLPGAETAALAEAALTFEEFIVRERRLGRFALPLREPPFKRALVHGHCHQKAFNVMPAVAAALELVPGLAVEPIPASCCGMAGAFGYDARHYDVSMAMAEAALRPAVRGADADTVVVADGTSCRHQIRDGAGREAWHVARVLAAALPASA